MQDVVLTPSDFVAVLNQTLEFAYPVVNIEGELSSFRISNNRWAYFNLKDANASVPFFGGAYLLPGPLQDGLMVRAVGSPRMHPKFGFTLNLHSIVPIGEGSLKAAAELLRAKLTAEGLFAPERKRMLPVLPNRVGLVTAENSAAYHDFVKILGERWGGVEVLLSDVLVQGENASGQIVSAIEILNKLSILPEVIVITRGGGSAEDLVVFNDERVVRAVAASRVPTLVAIGHEVDESLAEMAADARASTPSNAAQVLVPERGAELAKLRVTSQAAYRSLINLFSQAAIQPRAGRSSLAVQMAKVLSDEVQRLSTARRLLTLFNPQAALKRGYAVVRKGSKIVSSVKQTGIGDRLSLQLQDGTIGAKVITRK